MFSVVYLTILYNNRKGICNICVGEIGEDTGHSGRGLLQGIIRLVTC